MQKAFALQVMNTAMSVWEKESWKQQSRLLMYADVHPIQYDNGTFNFFASLGEFSRPLDNIDDEVIEESWHQSVDAQSEQAPPTTTFVMRNFS